jgi:hypothetical protein
VDVDDEVKREVKRDDGGRWVEMNASVGDTPG